MQRRWWMGIIVGALQMLPACSGQAPADKSAGERSLKEELPRIPAKSPAEALASFKTQHGFRMELLAAEPLVTDPIAGAYDEAGRLYVVEMLGYPYPEPPATTPQGNIRVLVDADGDGIFDKGSILVDRLSWPTALAVYDGGVFVAAAPDLWFFKDTDGDGKADVRNKVFTGFGKHNVQALVNSLQWGLDNWIHGSTAANAGKITRPDQPNAKPIDLAGRDFRFHPKTLAFELESGTAQYGGGFDAWGNRFVCSNSDHAQLVLIPLRYLSRNPHAEAPTALRSIAVEGGAAPVFRISQAEPWRTVRTRRRRASGQSFATTELFPTGYFTSATGITVYRGDVFPPHFHGNLFIGDVGGNLIHRKLVSAKGASLAATRADANVEFVASTDNWFRPVTFVNAPDGTLTVLDMYRETIEHPWSIPDDIRALLDLESGRDRGRVYRLAPPGFSPQIQLLDRNNGEQLVQALSSPRGWTRETAQRLLWERNDPSLVQAIVLALKKAPLDASRLAALALLDSLGQLSNPDLADALRDQSEHVRRYAIGIAENRRDSEPGLVDRLTSLTVDPSARVRFQLALTLGDFDSPKATRALVTLGLSDGADPDIRFAVLSGCEKRSADLLDGLLAYPKEVAPELLSALARVIGARRDANETRRLLEMLARPDLPAGCVGRLVVGFADGLRTAGASLETLAKSAGPGSAILLEQIQKSCDVAQKSEAPLADRQQALLVLGATSLATAQPVAMSLLDPAQPTELQLGALRLLGRFSGVGVSTPILSAWKQLSPAVQNEAMETLLARPDRIGPFLDAVATGVISPAALGATRSAFLLKHRDKQVRDRATKILAGVSNTSRAKILEQFRPALTLTGDNQRGRLVFERECSTCHRLADKGFEVGPNLATIQNRTPEMLLTNILDPNKEVLPNFVEYLVELDDGRLATGIIGSENTTSVTLKRPQGVQETLARRNIVSMTATGKSLMPEGLEKKLTPQELSDLIAFLLK